MSSRNWLQRGWLQNHRSSREEIRDLLGIADRDLKAAQTAGLPGDWRFSIAYNAALQAATAALAAAGYRAARENHHVRVIGSLEFTTGSNAQLIRTLDAFRKKRNASNYQVAGVVSNQEATEMLELAAHLRTEVAEWIRAKHPQLL